MAAVHHLASILVLLLAVACGGDANTDPHANAKCDADWRRNGFSECEAACADSSIVLHDSGPACPATTVDDHPIACSFTHEFAGIRGCCASAKPTLKFAECDAPTAP